MQLPSESDQVLVVGVTNYYKMLYDKDFYNSHSEIFFEIGLKGWGSGFGVCGSKLKVQGLGRHANVEGRGFGIDGLRMREVPL